MLPVLTALRSALGAACPVLSVDTFYASVAAAAVGAGAGMVNDVSGGTMDAAMLPAVAALGVPYVAMHMRGTPQTMAGLTSYAGASSSSSSSSSGGGSSGSGSATGGAGAAGGGRGDAESEREGVVAEVRRVLQERAEAAMAAGVARWNIVLDPGLGFAKEPAHSFALLAPAGRLVPAHAPPVGRPPLAGFPLLYGPSRKGFIGAATGRGAPAERVWGTAAAVTAAVGVGADIVRVHDVEAMVDVVRTADAVFRGF